MLPRSRLTRATALASVGAPDARGAILIREDGGGARQILVDAAVRIVPDVLAIFRVHRRG